MTETEWLACTDPQPMLEFLRGKASDRKLRLFACACCRRIWHLLTDERSRKAVDVGEKCADGETTDEEQFNAYEAACDAKDDAWCGAYENSNFPAVTASYVLAHNPDVASIARTASLAGDDSRVQQLEKVAVQCNLLRDIFGNPFRPVTVSPNWLTPAARYLAQAIYDDRAFDRMPILADALEDAGCTNADILNHCRQPGEHCRGCWVVDLLLGKE
jgi:hypothetical protein